jgi:AcrR family transcriptional regulator
LIHTVSPRVSVIARCPNHHYSNNSPVLTPREQIIEAARAAIEQHGPDALTRQIAERAGLARPNFYRYFSSKRDLDFAVARSAYRELRAEVRARLDLCGTPYDVIRAPIAAQVTWADSHPNLYRFLASYGYQRSSRRRKGQQHDFGAELLAAGGRYFPRFAENSDVAAAVVVGISGLVNASILSWLNGRIEARLGLIERLTTQAWLIIDHYLREIGVCLDPTVPLPQPG